MTQKLIAKLWEDATGSTFPRPGKFTAGEYDYHISKFLQLVVKECAKMDSENNNPDHRPGDMNHSILALTDRFHTDVDED